MNPNNSIAAPGGSSDALTGIGLRAQHHLAVLETKPPVAWLEAHSENYFAAGGARVACLDKIREQYPVSLHGVGLSLGSTDPLDAEHFARLKRAIDRFNPVRVSEHLSWCGAGGRFANDLLPLPYTDEAVRHVARRIADVQAELGRLMLIENVSSYMEYRMSSMPEWDFVAAVVAEAGCGLLLDINNVYVSATNHGFDAESYLAAMPTKAVGEFHLAGHYAAVAGGRDILIDTHGGPVSEPVWQLYASALRRFGALPTLIEWDTAIPELSVLVAEAEHASRIQREVLSDHVA
jgi:uncharacterized protein (UPF0276 family)